MATTSCLLAADNRPLSKASSDTDWPQWRGPHRDGISADTGLLTEWPKEGPKLLWKAGGLGRGFSSVAVVSGHIYTLGDREAGQFVIALDAANGKELWSTRIGEVWEPQGYAGPRCTPTVDGKLLYVI